MLQFMRACRNRVESIRWKVVLVLQHLKIDYFFPFLDRGVVVEL
jgi:hypothetical protein